MTAGDHLLVRRPFGYTHHGIDVGEGKVIHYSGEPGKSKRDATIRLTAYEDFADGGRVDTKTYGIRFSPEKTVERAYSRVGVCDYDLFGDNCEHFASWCCTGDHSSSQVIAATTAGGISAAAAAGAAGGIGVISAAGTAAGLSGAGVMSGLATVGGLVGGGAVAGAAVLGAAPGAAASVIMNKALADSPTLSDREREARTAGRVAAPLGAVAGTAGGVAAISTMGGVAGLSAAGITSGLATIGAVGGGGMVMGAAAVVAAPAIAAAGAGYAVYWVNRSLRR